MTKITKIDRTVCKLLAAEIEAALKVIADKYGLSVKERGGTFTALSYTGKIELAVVGDDGVAATKEVQAFRSYAPMLGLDVEDFGKRFSVKNRTFEVCGLKPGTNRPVLARDVESRQVFVFEVEAVKRFLAA